MPKVLGFGSIAATMKKAVVMAQRVGFVLVLYLFSQAAAAGVAGNATVFTSPQGIEERCVILAPIPGGVYSANDLAQESAFCEINFYGGDHALCPKLFSTSPGTLVYDISAGNYSGKPGDFEKAQCATGSRHKRGAQGEPVSFKMSVNGAHTSATFSTASLLYYHFSRYLNADVHVPVSVYRSIDKDVHHERVTKPGLAASAHRKGGAMNHGGWEILQRAITETAKFHPADEILTPDRTQLYGVFLHPKGKRYNAEVNGTRASGWGKGQNRDFQETAPFLALRSNAPLQEAIEVGIRDADHNATLRKAMRHGVAFTQVAYWMQELTEITFLDYIFSQQDRIGNIDYINYWYWVDGGEIKRMPASGSAVPAKIASFKPIRLRRTQLNDNDAGGRTSYANFTKKTGMLEKIRHYNPQTYRRVIQLATDFTERGELYNYTKESFILSEKQFSQLVLNVKQAAGILQKACSAGRLQFDLDADAYLLSGKVVAQQVDCENPG